MLQKKKFHYLASVATAVMSTVIASNAYGASGPSIGGLSSDGSVYLYSVYDEATGKDVYRLASTFTGDFDIIQMPVGASYLYANGLSADGKTVVGNYDIGANTVAFAWTVDGGFVDMGNLGGTRTQVQGVSADGAAAGGYARDISNHTRAFHWTRDGGIKDLGTLGGSDSYGYAISGDGKTVVGASQVTGNAGNHAFAWTVGDLHLRDLGGSSLYTYSSAQLASYDGSVVVGQGWGNTGMNIFRWDTTSGIKDIGTLGESVSAAAISHDGNVIVGQSGIDAKREHAYRYVASSSKMTDLGTLGGTSSSARDVTSDGAIVVGEARDETEHFRGFLWSDASGMISIEQWLSNAGVTPGSDLSQSAHFISDEGNVVVGTTQSGDTYVARVKQKEDNSGSGIIKMSEFLPTVAESNSVSVQTPLHSANTIMFGAQGSPMRNLLSVGQRSIWGTVDAGHDDGGSSDGNFVLGDFGFGYGIADGVTARFSAGGLHSDQDLDAGGSVRQKGFYLSPEVSADLGGDVFVTLGGYWGKSSVDSKRGYLNGATLDYSNGDTDADTWGAKIRFDWLNAFSINETAITPYVGLSYARTKVDGYTEAGGSFPVSYDDTSDHATIARLGADFVHPLSDRFRLLAKAEAAYQFEDKTEGANGTIVGLDNFSLAGQDLKQFWVRGGLGGEFDVGGGTASLMVNVTTQGQDPDVWVRSNWTVKF